VLHDKSNIKTLVPDTIQGKLCLQDGSRVEGRHFGFPGTAEGEVVFNTGMTGYTEALTDPSYRGQILVLTYPLIGNYGVPDFSTSKLDFESYRIQVAGLIVSHACEQPSHWKATRSLSAWLKSERIPALCSVDTRALTRRLRQHGTMFGSINCETQTFSNPEMLKTHPVAHVTVNHPVLYRRGEKRVILVDCGCKQSILQNLLERQITVLRVPYNYDFLDQKYDGIIVSNGPGDPKACFQTVLTIRSAITRNAPVFGICLGSQILALAAGGDTYKMKFGHRGQNQPCVEVGTKRCYITSQNHGYAVKTATLPEEWKEWFVNANDGSNEGIRHSSKPFAGVQFHPEAHPGPTDANFLFDRFVQQLNRRS
jgi:carbamoyl-phosphate synthase small subunit